MYSIATTQVYYDYVVQWGKKHQWGLWGGIKVRKGDNQCAGQTYIDLYLLDKKEERTKDIKANIDLMIQSEKKMTGLG